MVAPHPIAVEAAAVLVLVVAVVAVFRVGATAGGLGNRPPEARIDDILLFLLGTPQVKKQHCSYQASMPQPDGTILPVICAPACFTAGLSRFVIFFLPSSQHFHKHTLASAVSSRGLWKWTSVHMNSSSVT